MTKNLDIPREPAVKLMSALGNERDACGRSGFACSCESGGLTASGLGIDPTGHRARVTATNAVAGWRG
jgi:hypothetical protein